MNPKRFLQIKDDLKKERIMKERTRKYNATLDNMSYIERSFQSLYPPGALYKLNQENDNAVVKHNELVIQRLVKSKAKKNRREGVIKT